MQSLFLTMVTITHNTDEIISSGLQILVLFNIVLWEGSSATYLMFIGLGIPKKNLTDQHLLL